MKSFFGGVTLASLLLIASAIRADTVKQMTAEQRVARLEARVSTLEQALVELRGSIKEYHFETSAGKFVCGRCKLEEEK